MNIMIVDDEIVQIESLRRGLRSRGYSVSHASNGMEALDQLTKNATAIDLVITDYSMPSMNGIELLREIRRQYGNLPVIIMTAYGQKELVIDALRHRCDSYIEKPFTLDHLIHEIERTRKHVRETGLTHRISQLIPQLVHQINNPLMAITGSLELAMLDLEDRDTLQQCLSNIAESVDRISGINREIMDSGRKAASEFEPLNICGIMEACLAAFRDTFTLKEIAVELDVQAQPIMVSGSRFGLEQVFKNLIVNAVDAMEDAEERLLRIRLSTQPSERKATIAVEDSGCGITEEMMGRIFLPYVTGKEYGNGLGLWIVTSIVEEHDGKVTVQSSSGKGTTFTVTLPSSATSQGT